MVQKHLSVTLNIPSYGPKADPTNSFRGSMGSAENVSLTFNLAISLGLFVPLFVCPFPFLSSGPSGPSALGLYFRDLDVNVALGG